MKRLLPAAVFLAFSTGASANGLYGLWDSEHDSPTDKYVRVSIEPCENNKSKACGTIIEVYENGALKPESEVLGKAIIWDMTPATASSWKSGKIWAPDSGKTYKSKMQLVGSSQLKVSGCVLGGLICRDQVWNRAPDT